MEANYDVNCVVLRPLSRSFPLVRTVSGDVNRKRNILRGGNSFEEPLPKRIVRVRI